jgi:protein-disulfide isomerase
VASKDRQRGRRETWLIAALVVVAVALVGYFALAPGGDDEATAGSGGGASTTGPAAGATSAPLSDPARRVPGDPMALGAPDAPVTMVMYSDFRCPFCAKFSRDTEPELIDRYVDNGTLRLEWRDFPIFGEQSFVAARAGRAAAAQGRFWEFTRAVYAAAPQTGHPDLSEDVLIGFAEDAAVPDIARFTAEMRGTVHESAIQRDLDEAQRLGVPSTPAFLVNGMPLLGAQPLAVFTTRIDDAAGRS